jgi:hypothetical protein
MEATRRRTPIVTLLPVEPHRPLAEDTGQAKVMLAIRRPRHPTAREPP